VEDLSALISKNNDAGEAKTIQKEIDELLKNKRSRNNCRKDQEYNLLEKQKLLINNFI